MTRFYFRLSTIALFYLFAGWASAQQTLLTGTVLVSRNRIEAENTSPGRMNHLAILSGDHVVEAQAGIVENNQGKGVIRTSLDDYFARDYSEILALEPLDPAVGIRAAAAAESLVGLPFKKLRMNCSTVVKGSYRQASGERLRRLRIPDRALDFDDARGPQVFKEAIVIRDETAAPVQTVAMRRRLIMVPMRVRAAPAVRVRPIIRPRVRVNVGV